MPAVADVTYVNESSVLNAVNCDSGTASVRCPSQPDDPRTDRYTATYWSTITARSNRVRAMARII